MVTLTGEADEKSLGDRVPALAIRRARELRESKVVVLVLEEGDDVRRDFRVAGRYGLLTYLDDHYQAPFEYVRFEVEGGRKVYEALLAPSGRYLLVVPDGDWVHPGLRVVLEVEGEQSSDGDPENEPNGPSDGTTFGGVDRPGTGGSRELRTNR